MTPCAHEHYISLIILTHPYTRVSSTSYKILAHLIFKCMISCWFCNRHMHLKTCIYSNWFCHHRGHKITRSQDLGTRATPEHNESNGFCKKPASIWKQAHECHIFGGHHTCSYGYQSGNQSCPLLAKCFCSWMHTTGLMYNIICKGCQQVHAYCSSFHLCADWCKCKCAWGCGGMWSTEL